MRLLLVHSDFIEYEATKKALKQAPDIPEEARSGRMEECLCAFVTVEKIDEEDLASSVRNAAAEIREVANQVKTDRVMLYPYAHLSDDLAKPSVGEKALPLLEEELAGEFEVARSPFGWYKAFNIKCKGHPLSELSRHVLPGDGKDSDACCAGDQNEALKAEANLKSSWFILDTDGSLTPADEFNFKGHGGLKQFYEYEAKGSRTAGKPPAHIQLMQNLELVDYEEGSDTGNMRWFPKGQMIKRLLEEKVNKVCQDAGALQIETPIMYDVNHPALNKYLNKFPARQYRISSDDKELFLRFAACFGMYLTMGRSTLSYRHLPARIYELTHYSFRREQSGETSGIKRLRAFTMPDMHTLVADLPQATQEFEQQFRISKEWMNSIDVPYEAAVRFVRSFYEDNKAFAAGLAATHGKPMLVEMWDTQSFYFVSKFEFNVNDSTNKAFALSTVQIDTQNPQHFDIHYTGEDGAEHNPLLLHTSISGAIDRNLCAILETEAMKRDAGGKPTLPFWLSPTHIRFLPVSDEYQDKAIELAQAINDLGGRADVDDSSAGIGKKIRTAEKEWVPLIAVVGEKEASSELFDLRVRKAEWLEAAGLALDEEEGQSLGNFTVAWPALVNLIEANLAGQPRARLPLPVRLSQRPVFRG
ncbi:MAG: threonine--tRNA ligase [Thermoplasmatota archaeon]